MSRSRARGRAVDAARKTHVYVNRQWRGSLQDLTACPGAYNPKKVRCAWCQCSAKAMFVRLYGVECLPTCGDAICVDHLARMV